MKFRSLSDHAHEYSSDVGSRFHTSYVRDGSGKLVESGVEDLFDSIQKAGMGLALDDLIRRAKAGDPDAIPAVVDSYPDLTNVPTDLLSAHQMLSDAKLKYEALPSELKSKYGNNFESFLKASADGTVIKDLLQPNHVDAPPFEPTLSVSDIEALKKMINKEASPNA